MLVGPSPELEIALYTLCYLTRANRNCYVSLADTEFTIWTSKEHNELRLAHFVLEAPGWDRR